MRSFWVSLILSIPAAWAIWQLQLPQPLVGRSLLGILLLTLGLLAGLRLATEGLHQLLQDLIHANKELAGQVDQLAEEKSRLQQEHLEESPDEKDPLGE